MNRADDLRTEMDVLGAERDRLDAVYDVLDDMRSAAWDVSGARNFTGDGAERAKAEQAGWRIGSVSQERRAVSQHHQQAHDRWYAQVVVEAQQHVAQVRQRAVRRAERFRRAAGIERSR